MVNFLTLKTNVQNQVIDLPSTVQSAIPRLVNSAIKSAQDRYNFFAMEAGTIFTTVEGQILLGTLSDFKEYRDQGPFILNSNRKGEKLTTSTVANAQLAINQFQNGRPKLIAAQLNANTDIFSFNIFPPPDHLGDNNGNYLIVIPYQAYTLPLVNDGDANWFTNHMEDYITYKAVGDAFGLDWDNDNMAIWMQRSEEKFKEAKKADKTRRIAGINELAILWQGGKVPPVRW